MGRRQVVRLWFLVPVSGVRIPPPQPKKYFRNFMKNPLIEKTGELWVNYLSLELIIRFCLQIQEFKSKKELDSTFGSALKCKEGDELDENHFTNFKNPTELINLFNEKFPKECLDKDRILRIRHALAHGRMLATNEGGPWTVYKFSPPTNNRVTAEIVQVLDDEYLKSSICYFYDEINRLHGIYEKLRKDYIPK